MNQKRQHYVPQFYLKHFGTKFYCLDKTNGRIFLTNPLDVAVEAGFYSKAGDGEESLEKALSEWEGKYSTAVAEIIAKRDASALSLERHLDFCGFLAMQYLRSKEMRAAIEDGINQLVNEMAKRQGIQGVKIGLTEAGSLKYHLKSFKNYPFLGAIISGMKLITVRNKTGMSFWTSDHPTVVWNEYDMFPFGNLGLACKGIELHIPLTPDLAVIACDPVFFRKLPRIEEVDDEQRIVRENWLQLIRSTRFLISKDQGFPLAKEMLATSKDAGDPKRKRFSVGIGSPETDKQRQTPAEKKKNRITKLEFWMSREDLSQMEAFAEDRKASEGY